MQKSAKFLDLPRPAHFSPEKKVSPILEVKSDKVNKPVKTVSDSLEPNVTFEVVPKLSLL